MNHPHSRPGQPPARRRLIAQFTAVFTAGVVAVTGLQPAGLALAQGLPANALPGGWTVTGGAATFVQGGSTLTIQQATPQALVDFQTFNVGAGALVDIRQPGSTAALLARTVGGEPSQILGRVQANGALWLINPAGILVGPGARIDVGRFVASTLNVTDSDFLAGRLNFGIGSTGPAGLVRNDGAITAAPGGSIYLVAPGVTNAGTLTAPGGEVLLAAGQQVRLVDTGTPGVSVALTGAAGQATNLGRITAEAGRIGLAAGLVGNSGTLDASSAVREGGRIFLRASQDLTTSATSAIDASGTTGGRVVLYADDAARIAGQVKAIGNAGPGGYVETSGRRSLDVVHAPTVGRGGTWFIDPYDIEIVAGPAGGTTGGSAIVASESGAKVDVATLTSQLDQGVNVSIATGTAGDEAGNITLSTDLVKAGDVASSLTLNAGNNIVLNGAVRATGAGALDLNLNSDVGNTSSDAPHAVQANADISLGGGVLTVSQGSTFPSGNGTLDINGGTLSVTAGGGAVRAATVNVGAGGTVAITGTGEPVTGRLVNNGTVTIGSASAASDVQLLRRAAHAGRFDIAAGSSLALAGGHDFNAGIAFTGAGTLQWSDDITLFAPLAFGAGSPRLVLHNAFLWGTAQDRLTTAAGTDTVVDGRVEIIGTGAWANSGNIAVTGAGAILVNDTGARFDNTATGVITTSGNGGDVLGLVATGDFVNAGTLVKAGGSAQRYTYFESVAGGNVRVEGGSLTLLGMGFAGTADVAAGAQLTFDNARFGDGTQFTGAGRLTWVNGITLNASLALGAAAPILDLGPTVNLYGNGYTLSTARQVDARDTLPTFYELTWNNSGLVNFGFAQSAFVRFNGVAFNNQAGGVVNVPAGSYLYMSPTSVFGNAAGATLTLGINAANANGGNGVFGDGASGSVVNAGSIVKTGVGTTYIPLVNQAGGTLRVEGGIVNTAMDAANPNQGAIVLQAGSTLGSADGVDLYNSGSISGSGTIAPGAGTPGSFVNNGTVSPGTATAPGRIAVRGNYTQGAAGTLGLVLAGTGDGQYSVLDIDGTAALAGTLAVAALPGYAPADGQAVDVVTARAGRNGDFGRVDAPVPGTPASNTTLTASTTTTGSAVTTRLTAAVVPTVAACTANPALAGCAAVLPSLAQCTASPQTAGCSAVLPSLAQCSANPQAAGCAVVLPSVAACTAAPSLAGCGVVLPSLAQCTAGPASPGCSAVLPSLAACVANPAQGGCSAVLPTLASCTVSPQAAGCSVVLPALAACVANPLLAGCAVVLPSMAACQANPSTAGCVAVDVPAVLPASTAQPSAANEIIKAVLAAAPPAGSAGAEANSSPPGSTTLSGGSDASGTQADIRKKTYCN